MKQVHQRFLARSHFPMVIIIRENKDKYIFQYLLDIQSQGKLKKNSILKNCTRGLWLKANFQWKQ